LPRAYAQHTKELKAYYEFIDAGRLPVVKGVALTDDDVLRRTVIMRLMCDMALSFETLGDELGVDLRAYLEDEIESLEPFEEDGLVTRTWEGFDVTPSGRLLIRNIAMLFDPYLVESRARYSRTV